MLRVYSQPYSDLGLPLWKGTASQDGKKPCAFSQLRLKEKRSSPRIRVRHEALERFSRTYVLYCQSGFGQTRGSRKRICFPSSKGVVVMASMGSSSQGVSQGASTSQSLTNGDGPGNQLSSTIAFPAMLPRSLRLTQLSVLEQAFLLLGFIACMTSFALFALIVTAIPTFNAMRKAAVSMEKLANVAREELPATMAAIRLSGMEISDLTLELNDLSQEISDGMKNSARAVQAAEVGLRRMGTVAASQTLAMLQERASMPVEVVRPAVASAAATTLQAVAQAQQMVFNFASHPRITGWLGRKESQKQETMRMEITEVVETEVRSEFAASEEMLLPDETEFLLFDEAQADGNHEQEDTTRPGR